MKTRVYVSNSDVSVTANSSASWGTLSFDYSETPGGTIFASAFLYQTGGSAKITIAGKELQSVSGYGYTKCFGKLTVPAGAVSVNLTVTAPATGRAKIAASTSNILVATYFNASELSAVRQGFSPHQVDVVSAKDPSAAVTIVREYGGGVARYTGAMLMGSGEGGIAGHTFAFGGDFCNADQAIQLFEESWPKKARSWLSRWLVDQLAEGLADLTGGGKRP